VSDPRVAIIGATGAVGRVALQILEERNFAMDALRLTASHRSIGKTLTYKGQDLVIEETTPKLLAESDIAFVSANDDISAEIGELGPQQGCIVIDDSGVWRMDPAVPLVVPEINADDIDWHAGLLAIPNCSTTPLAMALAALGAANPIKRVIASTYQSVSGTGAAAVAELNEQAGQVLAGQPTKAESYPHQIAFNVLPHIGTLKDDDYFSEEIKMRQETQKILHAPEIAISTTCVRVPVPISHSEAVHVEFEHPMDPAEARQLLAAFPGIIVTDDPANAEYPMPIHAAGSDEIFVGRIRKDTSNPNGLVMWIVSDNLRKGAATNAIQIAEEIVKRDVWLRERV
jgi:aspartate-semialdehyde dehydrogenase